MLRLLCILSAGCLLQAQTARKSPDNWYAPMPPHRVVGNMYYVGTADLAEYLITTPQGHILINSNFERTVPLLRVSVEKLGFRMQDIKILLTSHAHADHAAGHAMVKELTSARVMVMDGDADVINTGGGGIKACPVDRVLRDGEEVRLGGTTLVAHLTPGHTRGCTTWTLVANEGGKPYRVVIVGSPNVNPGYILVNNRDYPSIAEDYKQTFTTLKAMPCDVFLGAHGSYYGLAEKYRRVIAITSPRGSRPSYRSSRSRRKRLRSAEELR
jgi:metallo-beta-lactamase class B